MVRTSPPHAAAAAPDAGTGDGMHREVEHVMGVPISLALRGRQARSAAGRRAWRAVVAELHEIDAVFSTYRAESFVSRLGRGEIAVEDCPELVAEVLELGRRAELESAGASNGAGK